MALYYASMNKPLLVAIGFMINALFGPLCMASMMQAMQSDPAMETAQHRHHTQSDCPDCQNDTQPSDCAGHCMAQAKNVSPSHVAVLPPAKGNAMPISYAAEFDSIAHEPHAESPVSSPPFLIALASTVLRL